MFAGQLPTIPTRAQAQDVAVPKLNRNQRIIDRLATVLEKSPRPLRRIKPVPVRNPDGSKFKDLRLNRPGPEKTARFGLAVRMGTQDSADLVMIERACVGSGQQQIRAICHRTRPDGETFGGDYYDWHNINRMSAGEFRLVRRGSRVYHLVREAGGQRFTIIESQPVNADPVDGIELGLSSDDAGAAGSVVVEELTIRGAR